MQHFDSGGSTVALRHGGTYRVSAHGGRPAPNARTVQVGGSNVRLEFER